MDGTRLEVELDVVEGPSGGQVSDGAALTVLGLASMGLTVRPLMGDRATVRPFGGRPAAEAATGTPGRGQAPVPTGLGRHSGGSRTSQYLRRCLKDMAV